MNLLLSTAATILRTISYKHAGDWAEQNRYLSKSESSEPGMFKTARTPYFIPAYEACESRKYRWVIVVCGSQMGKTEFQLNRIGYKLDCKPSPIMLALPTKDLARRYSKNRIAKLMNTPVLAAKLTSGKHNIFEIYVGGNQFRIAWATSASQLCSDPEGEVHLDELDRMEDDVEGEGNPVRLADARGMTFPDFLLVACSTPTVKGRSKIMTVFEIGTEQLYCAPCPHCGFYFAPFFSDLWWPKGASAGKAKREARVICPECAKAIDDNWRTTVIEENLGIYIGSDQKIIDGKLVGELKETAVASFRIPGLFSPWVSFGESAALWIDALKADDVNEIKTVINTRFGDEFTIDGEAPSQNEMEILRAKEVSPNCPPWALLLSAGVDVQKRGLYVAVRAWGPGGKSQLVLFTYLQGDTLGDQVWKDLEEKILNFPFETAERHSRKLFICQMAIDRRYREEMVDIFLARHKDKCVGAIGHNQQIAPVKLTKIDVTYEGRQKITGIHVLGLNDGYFKLSVFSKIQRGADVADCWLITADATEEYILQVLSEELITLPSGKQIWAKKKKTAWKQLRKDNHALDCEKINLAIAYWKNFRLLVEPEKITVQKRNVTQAKSFQGV